jgi:hypothetical protein
MTFAPLPSSESFQRRLQSLWRLLTRHAVVVSPVGLVSGLLATPIVLVVEFHPALVEALRYTLALGGAGYAGLLAVLFRDRFVSE